MNNDKIFPSNGISIASQDWDEEFDEKAIEAQKSLSVDHLMIGFP